MEKSPHAMGDEEVTKFVKTFLEKFLPTGKKVENNMSLRKDLNIDGDDADELFINISDHFKLDYSELDISRFFNPEPNLFSMLASFFFKIKEPIFDLSVEDLIKIVIKSKTEGKLTIPNNQ